MSFRIPCLLIYSIHLLGCCLPIRRCCSDSHDPWQMLAYRYQHICFHSPSFLKFAAARDIRELPPNWLICEYRNTRRLIVSIRLPSLELDLQRWQSRRKPIPSLLFSKRLACFSRSKGGDVNSCARWKATYRSSRSVPVFFYGQVAEIIASTCSRPFTERAGEAMVRVDAG